MANQLLSFELFDLPYSADNPFGGINHRINIFISLCHKQQERAIKKCFRVSARTSLCRPEKSKTPFYLQCNKFKKDCN